MLEAGPLESDEAEAGSLLGALPLLGNVERQAFRDQFTPAACEEAARDVDAARLYREALACLPVVERTLIEAPLLVRRYGRTRFAWLCQCLRDLGEMLEIERASPRSDVVPVRAERARRAATRVREELILALGILAAGDDEELARLDVAAGAPETPEAVAESLLALGRLAADWLDREGPGTRALAASVDLTASDLDAAHAAAHSLLAQDRDVDGRDLPAVRRSLGRAVLELRLVARVFERAHDLDARVPRLPSVLSREA